MSPQVYPDETGWVDLDSLQPCKSIRFSRPICLHPPKMEADKIPTMLSTPSEHLMVSMTRASQKGCVGLTAKRERLKQ